MRNVRASGRRWLAALCLILSGTGGCKMYSTTPDGIAARRVPPELLAVPRANKIPIDLSLLKQDEPDVYRLGPKDVLGVYIEGVLGKADEPPRTYLPEDARTNQTPKNQAHTGFPILVNEDGTLSLPLIEPLKVEGMTVQQASKEIRKAYNDRQILQPGQDRVIVSLARKRTYQVLVIRQDSGLPLTRSVTLRDQPVSSERGSGFAIDLVAYQNDVLHALTETGGLPGIDADNEVFVLRSRFEDAKRRADLIAKLQQSHTDPCQIDPAFSKDSNSIRIPLRLAPGDAPTFEKKDIVLKDGDIVLIKARETDVFYTGGLLSGNQIPLPRDYDLDVLEAVALAGGPVGGGGLNFRAGAVGAGVGAFGSLQSGAVPPSRITIVRETPPNGQFAIQVNIKKALVDPEERILIQPGDIVVLSYTPIESIGNFILSTFPFQIGWQQLAFRQ